MNSKVNRLLWIPRVLFLLNLLFFLYSLIFTKSILGNFDIIMNLFRYVILCALFYLTFSVPIVVGILLVIGSSLGLINLNALTTVEVATLSIRLITGFLFIVLPLYLKSKTTQSNQSNLFTNENPQDNLSERIGCPTCHKTDSVFLLSTAYLQSLPLSEKGIPDFTKPNLNIASKTMAPPKEPRKYIYIWWFLSGAIGVYLLTAVASNYYHQQDEKFLTCFYYLSWIAISFNNGILLFKVNQYTEKHIIPLYQKALHFWNGLYYCEEDNLIFDPVSAKNTDMENLRTFIVKETGYNDTLYQSLKIKPEKQTRKKNGITPLGLVGLFALFILFFFLTMYLIGTFASPVLFRGKTMLPTIHDRSIILSIRLKSAIQNPKRGDIVVYTRKGTGEELNWIGRVIGMPGETIEWKDGSFWIQHTQLIEPYLGKENLISSQVTFSSLTLKKEEYLILSDNRALIQNVFFFNPISQDNIQGKVYFFVNFSKD